VNIGSTFCENIHSSMLQTYLQIDKEEHLTLIGKPINENGLSKPLKIESAHIITCCIKLGSKLIGKEVTGEIWTRCDYNDRKGKPRMADGSLIFTKAGVSFEFKFDSNSDTLYLHQITYEVTLLPKKRRSRYIPVHLFGELPKTSTGINFITKDIIDLFTKDIQEADTSLLQKRGSLWTIGHIGSTSSGLKLITNIIPNIIWLAQNSNNLTLRGTSLYALGLISRTYEGKQRLIQNGWSMYTQEEDINRVLSIAHIEYKGDITKNEKVWEEVNKSIKQCKLTEEKQRVLKLIGDLSNHITQKNAIPELRKINQTNPEIFVDEKLYYCVVVLLENYSFQLQARKYIYQLFEKLLSSSNFILNYSKAISTLEP